MKNKRKINTTQKHAKNREKFLKIYVSLEKKEQVKAKADTCGLSVSEFFNRLFDKGRVEVKQRSPEEVQHLEAIKDMQNNILKIGVNLNQIAHHLNAGEKVNALIQAKIGSNLAALENALASLAQTVNPKI